MNRNAQVRRAYTLAGALKADTLVTADSDLVVRNHVYGIGYSYDRLGRRISMTVPTALGMLGSTTYGYNSETGDLDSLTSNGVFGTFRYHRTAAGVVDSLIMPDGTRQAFAVDADGRPTARTEVAASASVFHSDAVTFDGRGKMLSAASTTFGAARTTSFAYAGLGAVLSAGGPQSETYTRDALGDVLTRTVSATSWSGPFANSYESNSTRLARIVGTPAADTYDSLFTQYDAVGSLISRTERVHMPTDCAPQLVCDPPQAPVMAWSTLVNNYDGEGKLLSSILTTSNDGLPQIDTTKVQPYAAMGRGVHERYRYDALGRRVWRISDRSAGCVDVNVEQYPICESTVERTVYDGDQVLYEIRRAAGDAVQVEQDTTAGADGQSGIVAYFNGAVIDQPLGLRRGSAGAPLILHRDAQGAVDFATIAAGSGVGQPIDCGRPGAVSACTHIGWPGLDQSVGFQRPVGEVGPTEWWGTLVMGNQNATGVIDMRARQFDPKIGMFLQEDPVGITGGVNTYAYGDGDAVNHRDPTGLDWACYPEYGWAEQAQMVGNAMVITDTRVYTGVHCVETGGMYRIPMSALGPTGGGAVRAASQFNSLGTPVNQLPIKNPSLACWGAVAKVAAQIPATGKAAKTVFGILRAGAAVLTTGISAVGMTHAADATLAAYTFTGAALPYASDKAFRSGLSGTIGWKDIVPGVGLVTAIGDVATNCPQ